MGSQITLPVLKTLLQSVFELALSAQNVEVLQKALFDLRSILPERYLDKPITDAVSVGMFQLRLDTLDHIMLNLSLTKHFSRRRYQCSEQIILHYG